MGVYLAEQTTLFLKSVLLGGAFGLLYDLLRITRIALPTAKWAVFIGDVLFFKVCAAATFLFLMRTIDGQVRFFIFVGVILGLLLYFQTLSIPIMGVSSAVIRAVKAILRAIYRWILFPIWRIFYNITVLILRPARFLGLKLKKTAQRCKYSLKNKHIVLYNQLKRKVIGKMAKRQEDRKRKLKADVKKRAKKQAQAQEFNV